MVPWGSSSGTSPRRCRAQPGEHLRQSWSCLKHHLPPRPLTASPAEKATRSSPPSFSAKIKKDGSASNHRSSCFAPTPSRSGPGVTHHIRQLSRLRAQGGTRWSSRPLITASAAPRRRRQLPGPRHGAPGTQRPRPGPWAPPPRRQESLQGRECEAKGSEHQLRGCSAPACPAVRCTELPPRSHLLGPGRNEAGDGGAKKNNALLFVPLFVGCPLINF